MNKYKNIVVSCATDDKFCQHCGVMIFSLLNNSSYSKNIIINVFYINQKLSKENMLKLKSIVEPFKSKIIFFKIKEKIKFKECFHLNQTAYVRIFMANYLKKYSKFIYLDNDLIFLDDICYLWEVNLGDKTIGAVPFVSEKYLNWLNLGKIKFGTGVLIIDKNKFIKNKCALKMSNFLIKNYNKIELADQDAFNFLFSKNFYKLSPKFNLSNYFFSNFDKTIFSSEELLDIKKPLIVHFTGDIKPWNYLCINPYSKIYWENLVQTPWKDYKIENKSLINFFKKHFYLLKFYLLNLGVVK